MSSLYEELLVSQHAAQPTIRAQYCRLAKELHPDRSPASYEQFVRVQGAYNILKDCKKRSVYDLLGESSLRIFQDERSSKLFTSLVTPANVISFYMIYILVLINFFTMPILLALCKMEILPKLAYCFSFYFMATLIGIIATCKIIIKLKAEKAFNFRYEIYKILIACILMILGFLQILMTCLIIDNTIRSCRYFYLIPYHIGELINLFYTIRVWREEGEKPREEYNRLYWKTGVRLGLSLFLYLPLDIYLKVIMLLGIIFIGMVKNGISMRISSVITAILMFYIVASINIISEETRLIFYFFWIPPFLVGFLIMGIIQKKLKEKGAKSLFGRSKIPIEYV